MSLPVEPIPEIAPREASWRRDLDPAIVAAPGSEALLGELHRPGAVVVTTGQQPGLFTGALYTVHKALSAAALARRLARRWQRPVVPVFWIAGDDHDYVEASVAGWADSAGRLVECRLPPRPPDAPQRSMAQETLPAAVNDGLALLAAALPDGPFRTTTVEWLRRHYRPGRTLHAACCGALAELLAPLGVACLDATHPAVKRAQQPLIVAALRRAADLDATLAALPDPGTGIAAGDGATLVFIDTPIGRDRLLLDGRGVRGRRSSERYTIDAAVDLVERAPERFSANVLLRPVVEAAILPTVAYVAGPAEFRYQTRQASALYPLLGVAPQRPVRRWSGVTVEPWADRILSKLGITAEAVAADDGTLARSILRTDLPTEAAAAIARLRSAINSAVADVATAGTAIDPVLTAAVTGRARHLAQIADDFERLFLRHLKKRDDIAYAQFRRVAEAVMPGGRPQERVFTAANYLGRYGRAWLDAIADATEAWAAS